MKEIIVIGDIEMGAGTVTDDFISDKKLSELILELSKRAHPVDLVLNGDIFDFLKAPYKLTPKPMYTRYVTEEVALAKLRLVFNAHRRVFDALKKFAESKGKAIYFIIGNHDLELAFNGVKKELKKKIGKQVHFPGLVYRKHQVYVEHGHQYDFATVINPKMLFVDHNGKKILNNTFVAFTVISALIPLKEEHPFLERIKPIPHLLAFYRPVGKKVNRRVASYFLKSILYYPLRYYADPTYTFPTKFIQEAFSRIRTVNWEMVDVVSIFKKRKLRKDKIFVLGHIHDKYIEETKKRVILRPGSWRDEYYLDEGYLFPRRKRYVQIIVNEDGKLDWNLVAYPIKRSSLKFYDVVRDERKFLDMVRKEEGYE